MFPNSVKFFTDSKEAHGKTAWVKKATHFKWTLLLSGNTAEICFWAQPQALGKRGAMIQKRRNDGR